MATASAPSLIEAFEHLTTAAPDRCAIRLDDRDISYRDLDEWANAIASELLARRGDAAEPVAIAVRSPSYLLAAALGALKAGKFFVPVNPLHPASRLRQIFDELAAPLIVCDAGGGATAGAHALGVEDALVRRAGAGAPGLAFDGDRLAYVLYTSGSTGRPKGVAHTRRDMLHNLARHAPLGVGPDDCVTLISADGFAGAISNPYLALFTGAALAPYSFKDDGVDGLSAWLADARVTVFYGFPSFLRLVSRATDDVYVGLRLAYLGGETVLPADLAAARRLFPHATLAIGLNSTETGLTCLHKIAPDADLPNPVPVGHPVKGVEVAIVSDDGAPVPHGEPGEIEIRSPFVNPRRWPGGAALGEGRFRTGDRGRFDCDGSIVHLGRADAMIKIRGFRIEPAEVEAAIAALDGVAEVAVIATGDDPAEHELAAFVVGRAIDPVTVRAAVAHALPAAMIPAHVAVLDSMPRTPNGKLDRKKLPAPRREAMTPASDAPAPAGDRAEVEASVMAIWRAVLRAERVADDDDFFLLGGTSLSALAVISRVRRELGVRVPLAVLFETPTIGALADAVFQLRDKASAQKGLG